MDNKVSSQKKLEIEKISIKPNSFLSASRKKVFAMDKISWTFPIGARLSLIQLDSIRNLILQIDATCKGTLGLKLQKHDSLQIKLDKLG